CSHPDLTPQGGCKLCVVEIEGQEGALTSCTTEAKEGMVVSTKSDKLTHLRGVAMEFMLASHPSDCTSCPVYLNCELQSMFQYLGVAHSRLRRIEKKNIRINSNNPLIVRDMERCIQCGRCIRACQDIRGVGILKYNQKDGEVYVGTEDDQPLKEVDCRFCGACVEVCSTGALRDVEGTFAKGSPRELALIPCKDACPGHTDIPGYVRYISEGKYSEAVGLIREKLPFPHSLGFVCNHKCEQACRHDKLNNPVSIRNLKRVAVENDKTFIWKEKAMKKEAPTGKKVAVVGGGSTGLTAAYYLAKKGHAVTVFEKLPVAGGMLAVGIPEYRMPRDVIADEVEFIKSVGVELITDTEIKSVDELKAKGYDAVLLAIGATKGRKLFGGDIGKRVYSAVEFLRMVALKQEVDIGENLAIIGGGNVSFDCARTAVRLGVKKVSVYCLEPRNGMLADVEEITEGEEEGVIINNDKSTLAIEGTKDGPTGIRTVDVKKFSFAADGRLTIEAEEGSERVTEVDTVIFAAGQAPDIDAGFGVALGMGNRITVDADTLATDRDGVYAAGDAIYGTKFVIEGIASGRKAAEAIDRYLGGNGDISQQLVDREPHNPNMGKKEGFACEEREEPSILEIAERKGCFCKVDLGLDEEQGKREGGRCLQCDLRVDLKKVKFWTDYKNK
ncbi:MAG: FAD-dependent oxidoreductase, partial [Clostridiales bacterium]|nr:FAD-dependent oxidoreductase [Clostridiales bacterium]